MSIATTTVALYVGFDTARLATLPADWPDVEGGHIGVAGWLEGRAEHLERLYAAEFAELQLSCVFDYDITEALGAWLYANPSADGMDFDAEARRLVMQYR